MSILSLCPWGAVHRLSRYITNTQTNPAIHFTATMAQCSLMVSGEIKVQGIYLKTTREHILYYIFMKTIPSYEEWFASFWNRTMSCWLWSRSTLCFCTEVFENSRATLQDHILHWGYLPSKAKFLKVLESADVAVSTALHEFFGVSM